jgi:hypothetical protein
MATQMSSGYDKRIILRFRDLVTDVGGTIAEHRSILRSFGEVWWGWMMRPQEHVPRMEFCELKTEMERSGFANIFLFDTGSPEHDALYRCKLSGIAVAPKGTRIGSPEPEKTPEYYNRGRYPGWFRLNSIENATFGKLKLRFHSFPTNLRDRAILKEMIDDPVESLEALRHQDVTLWVVREV